MPGKPKKAPPVVSAEQLEKERKPAVTVGMGMKQTKVSAQNWVAQCRKEGQIRREWTATHAPQLEKEKEQSVRRHAARRASLEHAREDIAEREILKGGVSKEGQGRALYLKERLKVPLQEKEAMPLTEAQVLGWSAQSSELVRERLATAVQRSQKPRSKTYDIVAAELEAGGWTKLQ